MYIALCLFRDQFSHVRPIEQALADKVKFVYANRWEADEIEKLNPHIIIGINEHHTEIAECYSLAQNKGIPTLTLQDGILEWRHMFENPLFDGRTGPPLHAPVLADKIACIGLTSAMLIGNLGNWPKVELTGMPKLDILQHTGSKFFNSRNGKDAKTILVLTSSKPWFNDAQRDTVLREMSDLKNLLNQKRNIRTIWRVTKDLPEFLGIQNTYTEKSTNELSSLIMESDAVITTISTTILESQLMEKPTALLDYFNTPNFVGTRWAIRHPAQAEQVLQEMLQPSANDKRIQDYFLSQNLVRGGGPAAHRVADLVIRMIEFKQSYPQASLPSNLLQQSFISSDLSSSAGAFVVGNAPPNQEQVNLDKEIIARLKYKNQQLTDKLEEQTLIGLLRKAVSSIRKKNKRK